MSDERLDAEVVVIGSGAGGATTAATLAEAGFDVLVLEEGPWVDQGATVPFSLDQMAQQYRSGGLTAASGSRRWSTPRDAALVEAPRSTVVSTVGLRVKSSSVGPGSTGSMTSTPTTSNRSRDEVEKELTIGPVPGGRWGEPSDRLRRGAEVLGWQHDESPRWMVYAEGATASEGKRQSMTRTYLPRAQAAGARLMTDVRVDRLQLRGTCADTATYTRFEDGRAIVGSVRFRHVFVCGGAIQTPALLQRSKVHGNIGRNLAVHPTVKLAARFRDELNIPDDVPVHQVKEFAPGLSFGGSASHPGLVALSLLDNWREHSVAVDSWRRMSVYYAAITSEGRGRVQAIPGMRDPLVTYRLTRRDRALLQSGLARLTYLMIHAGAQEVYPSFRGAPIVRSERDLPAMQARFAASKASVMTVHLCSTVPLGEDLSRCGADSFGRVHGLTNVYVNDASLLPDAPGVNPQGSVMALAVRNARRFTQSETPHA